MREEIHRSIFPERRATTPRQRMTFFPLQCHGRLRRVDNTGIPNFRLFSESSRLTVEFRSLGGFPDYSSSQLPILFLYPATPGPNSSTWVRPAYFSVFIKTTDLFPSTFSVPRVSQPRPPDYHLAPRRRFKDLLPKLELGLVNPPVTSPEAWHDPTSGGERRVKVRRKSVTSPVTADVTRGKNHLGQKAD
ncbi:hypothetical protein Bbelb_125640 [Branchiostoma belcheri]|nr:hypothetical protein Bbelb_125640 [Branchiostoma belcheri]